METFGGLGGVRHHSYGRGRGRGRGEMGRGGGAPSGRVSEQLIVKTRLCVLCVNVCVICGAGGVGRWAEEGLLQVDG